MGVDSTCMARFVTVTFLEQALLVVNKIMQSFKFCDCFTVAERIIVSDMKANKRPKTYKTKAVKARLASEAATEFGRLGGLSRAAKMTPGERRASALKASKAAAEARRKKAKAK